jgi:excisionase family DNA binding protein
MTSKLDPLHSLIDNALITGGCCVEASAEESATDTLTVNEAAAVLNCSISFIYKLMDQGQVAFERRGRRKLPVTASVSEYRQRNLVPAQKPPEPTSPKRRKEPYRCKYL